MGAPSSATSHPARPKTEDEDDYDDEDENDYEDDYE